MDVEQFGVTGIAMMRRRVIFFGGLGFIQTLAGCEKGGFFVRKEITLTVVMYSFLDRPIFDILLNGRDLGVASAYGTTSMVTGVTVPMGEQNFSWRLDGPKGQPRNGETVTLKNKVIIKPSDIPSNTAYMGLYLYPDDTAEFIFTEFMPGHSIRGEGIMRKVEENGR